MNLQMIRAERLVNARQRGMLTADFVAALSDADRKAAFMEWLRRRSGWAWLAAEDSALLSAMMSDAALLSAMMSDADLLPLIAPHAVGIKAARDIIFASAAASAAVAAHSGAMSAISNSADAMVNALSSSTALAAMLAVPTAKAALMSSTALTKASAPKMTGATAPSGVASASSSAGAGYLPWLVFDRAPGTFWNSAVVASGTGNDWIQYSFPTDVFISSVSLTPAASAIYAPKDCAIQYSSDGVTFATAKLITAAATGVQSFEVMKAGFYKHWRLAMYSAQSGLNYLQLAELNFTGFVKP